MASAVSPLSAQTVDVHTHIIIPEYVEVLKAHGAELEEIFPLPEWDVEQHIAFMDSADIRTAVLTMPAPQPYYGDTEESAECIRRVNEVSARVKQDYPGRFKFCAALPLPDVDAAIREAIYALDTLGADGVKLATNSRGQYLGDEELDSLMEVLNERHAVIIIHPHRPTPYPEKIIATTPLAMYEYPAETTRAVANMLARNVLVRYPNLKVVVPHCGSFLPLALPRMKSILPAMVKQGYMQPIDWEENLSRLYFDLAGSPTLEVLRSLLTITTPDHILYGSDYPYLPDAVLQANLKRLKQTLASDEKLAPHSEDILRKNVEWLFERTATDERCPRASQPHFPDVFRRCNALLLLEHPAEMLGILEAEAVGHLGDGFPRRKAVLGKLDDELADVAARRVPGRLLDDIAEVVGRHTELVGTILHGGQAEGQLELVLEIVAEQAVEADEDVGVLYLSGDELAVVETLAEVERQFDITHEDGSLKLVRILAQFLPHLAHQRNEDVMFFVGHVQGFIHAVVEKRILLDVPFERETMQQVGMEQKRPTGNRHPLAIILFAANLSGSHAEQRTFVIIVFAATIVQIHIGIVPQEQPIHAVIVQAVAYGRHLGIVDDTD